MSVTLSDEDVANIQTQAGYVLTALTNLETSHPGVPWNNLHKNLNALALIGAYAAGMASTAFGGNGTVTSTTTTSVGIAKGGNGPA